MGKRRRPKKGTKTFFGQYFSTPGSGIVNSGIVNANIAWKSFLAQNSLGLCHVVSIIISATPKRHPRMSKEKQLCIYVNMKISSIYIHVFL